MIKILTTTLRYNITDEQQEEAFKLFNTKESYTSLQITETEYIKYWYLFDKIDSVREAEDGKDN